MNQNGNNANNNNNNNQNRRWNDIEIIINELIYEYLQSKELHHTSAMFMNESGNYNSDNNNNNNSQHMNIDRYLLTEQLNIEETPQTRQLPLLYTIIALLQRGPQESQK
jgi:hypothetical protein